MNDVILSRGWWPCCVGLDYEGVPLPDEYKSKARTTEAHLGVRFGDNGGGWTVLLDGEDVTNNSVELVAGDQGWVEVYQHGVNGKHVLHSRGACVQHSPDCGCHAATEIRRGRVQVIRRPCS